MLLVALATKIGMEHLVPQTFGLEETVAWAALRPTLSPMLCRDFSIVSSYHGLCHAQMRARLPPPPAEGGGQVAWA